MSLLFVMNDMRYNIFFLRVSNDGVYVHHVDEIKNFNLTICSILSLTFKTIDLRNDWMIFDPLHMKCTMTLTTTKMIGS